MKFNKSLTKLINDDSFYVATKLIKDYKETHPHHDVVSLGIGDVSFPIPKYVAKMMKVAVNRETSEYFVGYGNYYGIPELREAIRKNEYPSFSVDEIYVGQGTKSDCGDILELFDDDVLIGIPTPTYPIYINSCLSLNKKYELIKSDKNFIPKVPKKHFDVIYLCSPNNPTGTTFSYKQLKEWVDYAIEENAVIIYDNVYYRFISEGIKSIYEIEGARKCAIELRSFSKHVSFTGIRCSYFVIPNDLYNEVNKYWRLRTINRFNGASYVAQVGAFASFDKKAQKDIDKHISYYKENALLLRKAFSELGYEVNGGINAPYLWIKNKEATPSWDFFNHLLTKYEVVVVPGVIFGKDGDQYFRVSALGKRKDILKAIDRFKQYEKDRC